METYYKLARWDGWDFFTANTVNYRAATQATGVDKIVKVLCPDSKRASGVIYASTDPNNCFPGAEIPCSAYRVSGTPVSDNGKKYGFFELEVLEEIQDMNAMFGWNYSRLASMRSPFSLPKAEAGDKEIELLKQWSHVWQSLWITLPQLVPYWVWFWVGAVMAPVISDPVSRSLKSNSNIVLGTVAASNWAYLGSCFPKIKEKIVNESGEYRFQPVVDLWDKGIIVSSENDIWHLHSGEKGEVIWEGSF